MCSEVITLNLCELIGIDDCVVTYKGCGEFTDDLRLIDRHEISCCEQHYLDWDEEDVPQENSQFETKCFQIEKIEGYGIALIPINGHKIRIPGYSNNNGFYSDNLTLDICFGRDRVYTIDIRDCQPSAFW